MLRENPFSQNWFIWGLLVVVGFPLLTVVATEMVERLEGDRPLFAKTIRRMRVALFPMLAVFVFVRLVLEESADFLPNKLLLTALLILGISIVLSLVSTIVFAGASETSWRGQAPQLLIDIARFSLIVLGAAFVVAVVWGTNLGGIVAALGVGGIVVGLALQDTLASLFGGIALLIEKPFTVGDWIELNGVEGVVTDINWRTVRLRTRGEDLIVVPNITFGNQMVLNNSKPDLMHVERIELGFSYDDPPNKVKRVLMEVAESVPGVLNDPPPKVRTLGFGDSSVNYKVLLCMPDYDGMPDVRSEFMSRVWYAAGRNGLTIPFPIRTVIHHDAEQAAHRNEAIAELQKEQALDLIDGSEDPLAKLAPMSSLRLYAAGETIVREGEIPDSMLLVVAGNAQGTTTDSSGDQVLVAKLGPNDFVAVSALIRGQHQVMNVTAVSDVSVIALDPDDVGELADQSSAFAHRLQSLFLARTEAVARALAEGTPEPAVMSDQAER